MNPFQQTHQTTTSSQMKQNTMSSLNKISSANQIGRAYGQSPAVGQDRVKDIIQSTQMNFERMKRDLNEKDRIIEEKNLELSRLRMDITDVNNRISAEASYHQRTENVIDEMNKEIQRLNIELKESEN